MNREYTEVLVEQNINGILDTAYVYGAGRLSLDRFDGISGYYLYDPRGSVTGIKNEEGQIYQSYRYCVAGGITFGAPQYENEYTYNGESYNPNIKSQYLRARYYCVVTVAFITEDSYLGDISEPLTLNRYNYCRSSYLNYADSSGNASLFRCWGYKMKRKNQVLSVIVLMTVIFLTGCAEQTTILAKDFTTALAEAQERRIDELVTNMQQYIGTWKCEELLQPIVIGQDSTRSQLGIDLLGANIEILEDFTARVDGEAYDIFRIQIGDETWYMDGMRASPQYAKGSIVEIYYHNETKNFSAYFAENGLSFCSYAYGYYSAQRVDNKKHDDKELLENSILDMVKEAYCQRFGEVEQQLDQLYRSWHGYECVREENIIRNVGDHTLEIHVNDEEIELLFDGKSLAIEQLMIISASAWPDITEPVLSDLGMSLRDCELLSLYQENYIIILNQQDVPVVVAMPKPEQYVISRVPETRLYMGGRVYYFLP